MEWLENAKPIRKFFAGVIIWNKNRPTHLQHQKQSIRPRDQVKACVCWQPILWR
jgi:hypothetical protein